MPFRALVLPSCLAISLAFAACGGNDDDRVVTPPVAQEPTPTALALQKIGGFTHTVARPRPRSRLTTPPADTCSW